MSVALWPVFWGRVGLRAMTLPLLMCLGFDWLWRGLSAECRMANVECRKRFALAGVLVGLSAYTYLSSRAIPILLLAFVSYLAVFARDPMRGRWRHLALFLVVAALVALPLAWVVLANPSLQFRLSEVSGPLDRALAGDWGDVLANVPRALGMFTVRGDATVRDNWPDRPVFPEPAGALLFYAGLVIALARFRRPEYALALTWLGAMLVPTIVTAGAPNFTRTLGALPIVFALPGIAIARLAKASKPWPDWLRTTGGLALLVVFFVNAASTYADYFIHWPAHAETQFVFQADFAAIAKDIDASQVMDVSVGGLSNDTMDDPSLYLLRQRKEARVRWFDPGSPISSGGAILLPGGFPRTVYIPSILPVSPELESDLKRGDGDHTPVESDRFTRYHPGSLTPTGLPFRNARIFSDTGALLGNYFMPTSVLAGGELRLTTRWVAGEPIAYPRRIFVHLIDRATGRLVAQHDGLDAPTKFWSRTDEIAQVHRLAIPADTPPGRYELRLGLYDPITGARVLNTDEFRSEAPSDYVVLGAIEVTR
jgi:hypothetical protein